MRPTVNESVQTTIDYRKLCSEVRSSVRRDKLSVHGP